MAEVKKINNENYDGNFNILTETIIDENDIIPSNLIDGGWALRRKIYFLTTNESDYSIYLSGGILDAQYCGNKENIKTPDKIVYNGVTYNSYTFHVSTVDENYSGRKLVRNVKLSNGVTKIGSAAFQLSVNLEKVIIPTSVVEIGSRAFVTGKNTVSIYYEGTISQWNAITKAENWKDTNITTIHCADGDVSV